MKTCLLVTSHFPPSNLAAVHRCRIWAKHLPEFGWKPIILTTDWKYYEEELDWDLHGLLPEGLEILQAKAFPVLPFRLIGDLGLRSLLGYLKQIDRLLERQHVDFMHIAIPSFYTALLGRIVKRKYGLPYGIDYIDPWVHEWPGAKKLFSKAWCASRVAKTLEPWAVRDASAITGITEGYYEGVLERNPHLRTQAVTAFMPYGAEGDDFAYAASITLQNPLWERDGRFHGFYAGALLPKAIEPLRRLLEALALLKKTEPTLKDRFQLHFVGTGTSPNDTEGYQVLPIAEALGVGDLVTEHPHRMSYLRVLSHLKRADGVLVLGSTEAHYSPSKTFQAIQSGKPIFAMLHEKSTAIAYLRQVGGVVVFSQTEEQLPDRHELLCAIKDWMKGRINVPFGRDAKIPPEQTGRSSARKLAIVMDASS